MKVETVKVKHEDSYMIINKSDFDKSKHELYKETKKKPASKKVSIKTDK